MSTYRRKPNAVQAWQYNVQPQAEWPQWVLDYRATTTHGQVPIGAGNGVALVPTPSGVTKNVVAGEWLVLEGKRVEVFKDVEFHAEFDTETDETANVITGDPAPTSPPVAASAPAAAPAPTPAPAATPTPSAAHDAKHAAKVEARDEAKAAKGAAKHGDAPAAETPPAE